MKTRHKIVILSIIVIIGTISLLFTNLLVQKMIMDEYNRDPSAVYAHCAQQKYGEENNWKTHDGKNLAVTSVGLYAMNETHYIDNNICTWIERPPGVNQMLSIKEVKDHLQKIENENQLGDPGNRHPSFLGFYVDSHCTSEMIEFMQKYSSMFERETPLSVDFIGLPEGMNKWEYHSCFEGTKAKRGEDTSANTSRESSIEPESPLTSEELDELCKTGQALCQPPIDHGPTFALDCPPNTEIRDGVCTVIDNGCEPDMYGNIYCDNLVEDALTLERFLFEPPIINEQPTFPMILIFLTIPLFIGIYWWKKRKNHE